MRITNKIMQRNNLSNINTNKIYQDKLSTQMSTQKKINRPSDDPVVAIRALRLRSSVTEVTQYYSKNIPDAESWLNVTEDALKNLSQIITNMISQCTKGSNGPLKTEDRQIILEQLKALSDEVYSTGDADYAGRYVFTGYRTDTSLSFEKEETLNYTITEQLTSKDIDSVVKVNLKNANGKSLLDLNSKNFADADMATDEEAVTSVEIHRFRLAYDSCSDYSGRTGVSPSISYIDENGNTQTWTGFIDPADPSAGGDIQLVHSYDDPYTMAAKDPDAIIYVPETGEMLLGENRYKTLMGTKDDDTTIKNEAEIRVTYEKSSWQKGDLRPQHYFYCESDPGTADAITYNKSQSFDGIVSQRVNLPAIVVHNHVNIILRTDHGCGILSGSHAFFYRIIHASPPVGHHHSLIAPLSTEDSGKHIIIGGCVITIDAVIGGHDGACLPLFHCHLKAF